MSDALTADDLLPLVAKLPHDQQIRLAKLVLRAAVAADDDAAAYLAAPVTADEFADDDDSLGWESDGWEGFIAPR